MKNKPSVLVVEESRGAGESLRQILKDEYNVHVAANLADAEQLLESHCTDAIMLEPWLRGLQGQPLLDRLRAKASAVPVIIVSGYPLGRWFNGDVREQIFAYFPKPFDILEFKAAVRKCVGLHAQAGEFVYR